MPSTLILIAHGSEESEFTVTYDTLVRAGVSCTSAFVPAEDVAAGDSTIATCSRGLKIVADTTLSSVSTNEYDLLVIPGGAKGAETLSQNSVVQSMVRDYISSGKLVGMICAGSLAAKTSNLPSQPLTSHPSAKGELETHFAYSEDPVVVSGSLVTSRGPGTTFPFALKLVELLCGAEKRAEVRGPMVFPDGTPW